MRRRLSRNELIPFFTKLPPCLIGLEVCSRAHHWARELVRLGHTVRLTTRPVRSSAKVRMVSPVRWLALAG